MRSSPDDDIQGTVEERETLLELSNPVDSSHSIQPQTIPRETMYFPSNNSEHESFANLLHKYFKSSEDDWKWHYAISCYWDGMSYDEYETILSKLVDLSSQELEILHKLETNNWFPYSMHPINKLIAVRHLHDTFTGLNIFEVNITVTYGRLERIAHSCEHELRKENSFRNSSKLSEYNVKLYPGHNTPYIQCIDGLNSAEEEYELVKAFNEAKQHNLAIVAQAAKVIEKFMPAVQRYEIIRSLGMQCL